MTVFTFELYWSDFYSFAGWIAVNIELSVLYFNNFNSYFFILVKGYDWINGEHNCLRLFNILSKTVSY